MGATDSETVGHAASAFDRAYRRGLVEAVPSDIYKQLIRDPQNRLLATLPSGTQERYAEIRALVTGVTAMWWRRSRRGSDWSASAAPVTLAALRRDLIAQLPQTGPIFV